MEEGFKKRSRLENIEIELHEDYNFEKEDEIKESEGQGIPSTS